MLEGTKELGGQCHQVTTGVLTVVLQATPEV